MTPSQPNKRQLLLTSHARLPFHTALERKEVGLEITDAAASLHLSKKAKRTLKLLGEAINLVYYLYDADFYDLEELREAVSEEELVRSEYVLLCDCR